MARDHDKKTNAIRELDAAKLPYQARFFEGTEALSGVEVARKLDLDQDRVFKTLVTRGKSGTYRVFMIPVACELDLKKAASAAGEKAVAMIKSKELLPLTGYVHGGCSPIGMKNRSISQAAASAANWRWRLRISGPSSRWKPPI